MPGMYNLNRGKKWVEGNPANDEDDEQYLWWKNKQEKRKCYVDSKQTS